MRQAGSPEPAADGGSRAHHDAALTQLGLDLHQRDVGLGIEKTSHERLMWLEDRSTVSATAGRSRTAALTKAPHQLHSRRRATSKRKAACRIEDPPATARTIRSRIDPDRADPPVARTSRGDWLGIGGSEII